MFEYRHHDEYYDRDDDLHVIWFHVPVVIPADCALHVCGLVHPAGTLRAMKVVESISCSCFIVKVGKKS